MAVLINVKLRLVGLAQLGLVQQNLCALKYVEMASILKSINVMMEIY